MKMPKENFFQYGSFYQTKQLIILYCDEATKTSLLTTSRDFSDKFILDPLNANTHPNDEKIRYIRTKMRNAVFGFLKYEHVNFQLAYEISNQQRADLGQIANPFRLFPRVYYSFEEPQLTLLNLARSNQSQILKVYFIIDQLDIGNNFPVCYFGAPKAWADTLGLLLAHHFTNGTMNGWINNRELIVSAHIRLKILLTLFSSILSWPFINWIYDKLPFRLYSMLLKISKLYDAFYDFSFCLSLMIEFLFCVATAGVPLIIMLDLMAISLFFLQYWILVLPIIFLSYHALKSFYYITPNFVALLEKTLSSTIIIGTVSEILAMFAALVYDALFLSDAFHKLFFLGIQVAISYIFSSQVNIENPNHFLNRLLLSKPVTFIFDLIILPVSFSLQFATLILDYTVLSVLNYFGMIDKNTLLKTVWDSFDQLNKFLHPDIQWNPTIEDWLQSYPKYNCIMDLAKSVYKAQYIAKKNFNPHEQLNHLIREHINQQSVFKFFAHSHSKENVFLKTLLNSPLPLYEIDYEMEKYEEAAPKGVSKKFRELREYLRCVLIPMEEKLNFKPKSSVQALKALYDCAPAFRHNNALDGLEALKVYDELTVVPH